MRRRDLLWLLGSMAAWPMRALAQHGSTPVIGFLSPIAVGNAAFFLKAYREGLKEAGFVEGQNVRIEFRWADGQYERLPVLAAELLNADVNVITTMGDAAYAAKAAQSNSTNVVPVVFALGDDPVASGLVESLSNPGTYITGATSFGHSLGPKKLEMLASALPSHKSVGVTQPETNRTHRSAGYRAGSGRVWINNSDIESWSTTGIEDIFADLGRERLDVATPAQCSISDQLITRGAACPKMKPGPWNIIAKRGTPDTPMLSVF